MKSVKIALSMLVVTMGLSLSNPTIEPEASNKKTEVTAKQSVAKSTPAKVQAKPKSSTKVAPKTPAKTTFKNCTELRKVHPKGVKKGHKAYLKKHDRDNDGWACEIETKAKKK